MRLTGDGGHKISGSFRRAFSHRLPAGLSADRFLATAFSCWLFPRSEVFAAARRHNGGRQNHGHEQNSNQKIAHIGVESRPAWRPQGMTPVLPAPGVGLNSTSAYAPRPEEAEPLSETPDSAILKNFAWGATLVTAGGPFMRGKSRRASHTATLLGQRGLHFRFWSGGLVDFFLLPSPHAASSCCSSPLTTRIQRCVFTNTSG